MAEVLNHNQTFGTPSEALAHFGVKGMQWGVHKSGPLAGIRAKTAADAHKDAREFARAKMYYGDGAGTRRKLIKAKVDARSAKDPAYKKAFEHHLANQDMGKHAEKARSERKRTDVKTGTGKAVRGAHRQLTGGMGTVGLSGAVLAGGIVAARKANLDKVMANAAKTQYKAGKKAYQSHQGKKAVVKLLNDLSKQ